MDNSDGGITGSTLKDAEELLENGKYEPAGAILLGLAERDNAQRVVLYHRAAVAFWKAGRFGKAAGIFRKAAVERRRASDRLGEARELIGVGASYHGQGRLGDAYRTIHQSIVIAEEVEDPKTVADATNWLGIICKDQGEYSLALEHHMRSLRLSSELDNPLDEASTLNSLGLTNHHMGDYDKALEHFRAALVIQREHDTVWGLPDTLSNMGMTMKALGKYDEALELYNEALELRRKAGGRARIGNILNNIGNLYGATGKLDQAIETHRNALALRVQLGNKGDISRSLFGLGEAFETAGRPDRAVICLENALRYQKEIDLPDIRLDTMVALSRAVLATGDASRAYSVAIEALELSTALYDGQVEKRLLESRAILETEHRAREARALESKNEKLQELTDMLAAQKEQLQLIFDYVPAVILFRDREGRLVRLNRYTADLLGRDPRDLVGVVAGKILGPLGTDPPEAAAALAVGEPVLNLEESLVLDDRQFVFRTHRVPFRGADGSHAGTVLLAVDITEEIAAETRKAELQRVLERGRRLESMGYLAGTLAHDFNNLLVSIMGNIELAGGRTGEPEVRLSLRSASDSARRAAELCKQLLAFSGGGPFDARPLDINREMEFFTESHSLDPYGRGTIRTRLENGLAPIKLDPSQLHLALEGIISLWEGCGARLSSIELRTGRVNTDEGYFSNRLRSGELPPAGEYIFVEVSADGTVLTEGSLKQLLDPFLEGGMLSSDLGVPAAHGVARAHGGFLTSEPESEGGGGVRLHFPVITEEGSRVAEEKPISDHPCRTTDGSILIVDDELEVRDTASEMLRSAGYEVISCASGRQALDTLEDSGEGVSCVLLDLTMPGLSGHEVIAEISRRFPGLGVVISSGYSERAIDGLAGTPAFRGFLKKPYTTAELVAAVNCAMG